MLAAHMDFEELGKRIRTARKTRRLSLESVASKAGISGAALSYIERGKTHVTLETLEKIAEALECDLQVEIIATNEASPAQRVSKLLSRLSPSERRTLDALLDLWEKERLPE